MTPRSILLVAIVFAFFGAGHGGHDDVLAHRLRDGARPALPRAPAMPRVDPRTSTPVPATILIFVVGVVLMLVVPGAALLELITASTILPALIYGATVILYLAVRKRLERKEGAFSLGRFELPVADRRPGLVGLRAVRPGEPLRGAGAGGDRGRPADPGRAVLRLPAALPPRGAGDRARRRQRLQALTER